MACAAMVMGVSFAGAASAQQFRLIAGGDGDGGPALQANLAGAGDAVYDKAGNLYVSQPNANRIRRIAPNGTITTVVGGNAGFGGDGGPASAAKISSPKGLAFDAAGNLYFADQGNRRVRRISTTGIITTVAGTGARGGSGDGGQATAATFITIEGLAIDASGNLFVSDFDLSRVRKIAPNGVISTIAGNGTRGYSGDGGPGTSAAISYPFGLDVDVAGNVYFADWTNDAIRKITPGGIITTFVRLPFHSAPTNVAVSPAGRVYASSYNLCTMNVWDTAAVAINTAGNGTCGDSIEGKSARFNSIGTVDGITFDPQGRVVFVDTNNGKVRRLSDDSLDAVINTIAGVGGGYAHGRPALGAPLGALNSIARDLEGNLLVADGGYRRVRRITSRGTIETLGGTGFKGRCPVETWTACAANTYGFSEPWGIAPGNAAGQVVVSDPLYSTLGAIAANGTWSLVGGGLNAYWGLEGRASQTAMDPTGIVRTPDGDLLIADPRESLVRRLHAGLLTRFAGTGTYGSTGDGGLATKATLARPHAIAMDAAGNVYVSESNGMHVRKIDTKGIITTIAGNGSVLITGDGGPAVNAGVGVVTGIAVRGTDIYLAAEGGSLRRIDAKGIITTLPFTQRATSIVVDGDLLYVATKEGRIYAASFAPRRAEHDYDGDGRSDVLWRDNAGGTNVIWKSANNAAQQAVTGVTNLAWKVQGQGDFDGDGRDDIVWRDTKTGANTVWRAANGTTALATTGITDLGWSVVGVGDFNKDGKSDLVWRHKGNGQNAIWRTLGGAGLAVTTVPDQNWQIVAVGDFNGDLVSDLFWRNAVTGANQVWLGGDSRALVATSTAGAAWKVQGVGDFDGDGRSDLFWRNMTTGQDAIWNGANAATSRTLTTITDLKWKVAAVGDYNGDGKDDLLWRHATSGANTIWKSANGATVQTVTGVTNTAWSIVPYTHQP